jgi:hypothetical protein
MNNNLEKAFHLFIIIDNPVYIIYSIYIIYSMEFEPELCLHYDSLISIRFKKGKLGCVIYMKGYTIMMYLANRMIKHSN